MYERALERSQWLPASEVLATQWEGARKIIEHAYLTCPYYRKRFDALGIIPSDVRSFDDWSCLPILEKSDVQKSRDEMVSTEFAQRDLIKNQTGGSTGEPISYFLSQDRLWSRTAATRRHDAWAGYRIGDKRALIWGAVPDAPRNTWKYRLRNALIDRSLYLDASCITPTTLCAFDAALKRFRPKVIQAYAKSLALFARYIEESRTAAYQPQSIITSAEVLTEDERRLAENVFGCPVFNRYGCREFSVIASECECHHGMHTMAEGMYVEVISTGAVGSVGSLVITDLWNRAMPMIRYRIGDLAQPLGSPCACGRGLPRISNIEGRITDFLVGDRGQLVSGVFLATYVISQRPSLGQVQLLQEDPRRVCFRICLAGGQRTISPADVMFLRSETKRILGPSMEVDVEPVDELVAGPSGKFLYCRSTVARYGFATAASQTAPT